MKILYLAFLYLLFQTLLSSSSLFASEENRRQLGDLPDDIIEKLITYDTNLYHTMLLSSKSLNSAAKNLLTSDETSAKKFVLNLIKKKYFTLHVKDKFKIDPYLMIHEDWFYQNITPLYLTDTMIEVSAIDAFIKVYNSDDIDTIKDNWGNFLSTKMGKEICFNINNNIFSHYSNVYNELFKVKKDEFTSSEKDLSCTLILSLVAGATSILYNKISGTEVKESAIILKYLLNTINDLNPKLAALISSSRVFLWAMTRYKKVFSKQKEKESGKRFDTAISAIISKAKEYKDYDIKKSKDCKSYANRYSKGGYDGFIPIIDPDHALNMNDRVMIQGELLGHIKEMSKVEYYLHSSLDVLLAPTKIIRYCMAMQGHH
ncbi:MAG: hypothetical protein HQK49_06375 [Oligoflexia bacterium]|nr:hypothetical protein [Oligoflexia bacterium]